MGALGLFVTGVLCAAVLSVVSRVPPDPVDQGEIPAVEIGSSPRGDVTPALGRDDRAKPRKGAGRHGSDTRAGGDGGRKDGGRPATARGRARGGPGPEKAAGPDDAPDTLGPADGSRGAPAPGTRDEGGAGRDDDRLPGTGARPGDDDAVDAPRTRPEPAPVPAPARTPRADADPPDEVDSPAPAVTGPAPAGDEDAAAAPPAATNPAPEPDGPDDSDGG